MDEFIVGIYGFAELFHRNTTSKNLVKFMTYDNNF